MFPFMCRKYLQSSTYCFYQFGKVKEYLLGEGIHELIESIY
jgi:hypothetical protein